MEIARYQAPARELEKQAEAIADMVILKLKAQGIEVDGAPFIRVEPMGKDIYLEAGYESPIRPSQIDGQLSTTVQDYPVGKYLLEEAVNPRIIISNVGESVA